MKIFASGIVEYYWSNKGRFLLFPQNMNLYYYDLRAKSDDALHHISGAKITEGDVKFSPKDNYISYISSNNIWRLFMDFRVVLGAESRFG